MGDFIDREKLNAEFDEHVKQANQIFGDTEQMSRVLDETDRVLFSEPILKDACPDINDLNGMVRRQLVVVYLLFPLADDVPISNVHKDSHIGVFRQFKEVLQLFLMALLGENILGDVSGDAQKTDRSAGFVL